jgi:hypothetical protein
LFRRSVRVGTAQYAASPKVVGITPALRISTFLGSMFELEC